MTILSRPPLLPILRPFVALLWSSRAETTAAGAAIVREHMLPTGAMHIAIRLGGAPIRLIDRDQGVEASLGHAVIGGMRDHYYVKRVDTASDSIGVQLLPGAARALFGCSATELSGRHSPLTDLWGPSVDILREQLCALAEEHQRLHVLETFLAARLPRVRMLHPAIAQALAHFDQGAGVGATVAASGCSHRRFIALFDEAVGLAPKRYCRVLRFQRVLAAWRADRNRSWADLALAAGYSDQAHLAREFRAFSGVAPTQYRRTAPAQRNHLRLAG